jgi:hypothetical protein
MAQSAAVIGLSATGPQDQYVFADDADTYRSNILQHSHFTKFHRTTYPQVNQFVGQTVEFVIDPKEYGDLMTNMYLSLTLPALASGVWTPWIGRAIIEHVEFRIGPNIVEKIDDNWYILRDQLFLDADEKLALASALNGGLNETQAPPTTSPLQIVFPMELFFCRRHSFVDPNRENIEKPPLPLCALSEFISIKFFFRPASWFTNYTGAFDFSNVTMITEEILLTREERLYYQSRPLDIVIQQSYNNPSIAQVGGVFTQNFSAKFPVTMLAWYVRNKTYESATTLSGVQNRFTFGYLNTTGPTVPSVPLTYFNGVTSTFVDTIQTFQIYLNGKDITDTFGNSYLFQFKMSMDHELTIPSSNIYTYSFGIWPHEYNQGGYLNFEKLDQQSSKMNITFNPAYASDIASNYTLYIYYYGYQVLTIANRMSSLLYK